MRKAIKMLLLVGVGLTAGSPLSVAIKKPKLKPEELVALHLDSIGPLAARESRKSCQAVGEGRLAVLAGREIQKRMMVGRSTFISEGINYRSSLRFPVSDYPKEELAYDGKKTYVSQLNPGQRSLTGQFLYQYESLLKEGLIGGSLSTAWPLLDLEHRKPKLKYEGLKEQFGHKLHSLQYRIRRGGGGVQINLFFDPESYRHLATIYRIRISDPMASSPETAPRKGSTKYTLEERFGDFRIVDGLTIPFGWKVRFVTQRQGAQVGLYSTGSVDWSTWTPDRWEQLPFSVLEWEFLFRSIELNVAIDPKFFILY
jgi:hypothetical protein